MSDLIIRPAQLFDAQFAAPLIQSAIGSIGLHLTGTQHDDDAAQVIAQFFVLRGNRLSFTHALIAEQHQRPVGIAVCYLGAWASALDEPFVQHRRMLGLSPEISSEGREGEWYLDTLATLPHMRGQGIGAALLQTCLAQARRQQLPLALLVEQGNPAQRLYQRTGFEVVGREVIEGREYQRMWAQSV